MQHMSHLKYVNETIPYIKKVLKEMKYSDDDLREVMKDEEKFLEFSKLLYSKLPTHLKIKVKEKDFLLLMQEKSKEAMKKKKNKKKVFG